MNKTVFKKLDFVYDDSILVEVPTVTDKSAKDWAKNYDKKVDKIKTLFHGRWQKMTAEVLRELYIARESLKRQGNRKDLFPDGTKSFKDYLKETGIPRSTANRWLKNYEDDTQGNKDDENNDKHKKNPIKETVDWIFKDSKQTLNQVLGKFDKAFDPEILEEFEEDIRTAIKKVEKKLAAASIPVIANEKTTTVPNEKTGVVTLKTQQ